MHAIAATLALLTVAAASSYSVIADEAPPAIRGCWAAAKSPAFMCLCDHNRLLGFAFTEFDLFTADGDYEVGQNQISLRWTSSNLMPESDCKFSLQDRDGLELMDCPPHGQWIRYGEAGPPSIERKFVSCSPAKIIVE